MRVGGLLGMGIQTVPSGVGGAFCWPIASQQKTPASLFPRSPGVGDINGSFCGHCLGRAGAASDACAYVTLQHFAGYAAQPERSSHGVAPVERLIHRSA